MAHRKLVELRVAREWFYFVDSKGLLYLEETSPKIFTSALKDLKFLVLPSLLAELLLQESETQPHKPISRLSM